MTKMAYCERGNAACDRQTRCAINVEQPPLNYLSLFFCLFFSLFFSQQIKSAAEKKVKRKYTSASECIIFFHCSVLDVIMKENLSFYIALGNTVCRLFTNILLAI